MKKQHSGDRTLALMFLLLAGAIVYLATDDGTEEKLGALQTEKVIVKEQEVVNKHISQTSQKIELEQMKMEIENRAKAPKVGDMIFPEPRRKETYTIDHSPDSAESQTYQDLNRDQKENRYFSPNAQIQSEIHDQQKMAEYQEDYREAYVEKFLENARRHGYHVVLDTHYRVISVKKISRPPASNLQVLPGESNGLE